MSAPTNVPTMRPAAAAGFSAPALDAAGLDIRAVFDLDRLPEETRQRLQGIAGGLQPYRQLILIGNAGPAMWRALDDAAHSDSDPIDSFSARTVREWFVREQGDTPFLQLYPGPSALDLQALGRLAGWHHASPLKVGINNRFGTWFAYRVALLAATRLPVTPAWDTRSPCIDCTDTPCISACPAAAVSIEAFSLQACIDYRRRDASPCAASCLSRLACPAGRAFRYDAAQIRHSYANSLRMIERYAALAGKA